MANIQASLKGWSTTEASNQPDSTDATTLVGDLRAIQAGIRYYFSQDTIASAATTDLGSKEAGRLSITGTTTITALGTVSAGIKKRVVFAGALTLTHNGTSLILPSAANITTAANDRAEFESLGSGNWICNWYQRASGQALVSPLSDGDKGDITVSASGATWTLDETSITGKAAETAPAVDDLLLLSDTSESAALNKITLENLLKVVNGLTEDTAPDTNADYLLSYDASASSVKKVLFGRGKGTLGTATAATSGTSIDFTGIPSWVKRITIELSGVSTTGTSPVILQIGDSGGIENTGYLGCSQRGTAFTNYSSSFQIEDSCLATTVRHGALVLSLLDASTNTWTLHGGIGWSNLAFTLQAFGAKSLSATLDRVRLSTVGGTETFDAGTVNILYEG